MTIAELQSQGRRTEDNSRDGTESRRSRNKRKGGRKQDRARDYRQVRRDYRDRGTSNSRSSTSDVKPVPLPRRPSSSKKKRVGHEKTRSWEDAIYRTPRTQARRDRVTGRWERIEASASSDVSETYSESSRFDARTANESHEEWSVTDSMAEHDHPPLSGSRSRRAPTEPRGTKSDQRRRDTSITESPSTTQHPSREKKRHLDRILKTHQLFRRMKIEDQYLIAEDWDREQTKSTLKTIVEAVGHTAAYRGGPVYKKRSSNHFAPPPKDLPTSPPACRTRSGRVSRAPERPQMVNNVALMPRKFWPKATPDDNLDATEEVDLTQEEATQVAQPDDSAQPPHDNPEPTQPPLSQSNSGYTRPAGWLLFGHPQD